MQRALYDPERGYYTARIQTVGARGDFSTTATLTPTLGHAIAKWLLVQSTATGVRTIIEVGGGDGSLMAEVQRRLGWWRRWRFSTLMVETSPNLRQRQQARLGRVVKAWHETLEAALAACAGKALIYHNELMDAFPFTLVQWLPEAGEWQEVHLQWPDGGVVEVLVPFAADSNFSILQTRPQQPQRAEISTALREWLGSWMPSWRAGAMLSIDYGETLPQLYHRRPRGTLRGYLLQQRLQGHELYGNPGRQDITADINFTDVRQWLSGHGLMEESYESQAEFLKRYAIPVADAFSEAHAAFKVLSTRRNLALVTSGPGT